MLLFCDSFDHYTTVTQKWNSGAGVIGSGGRFGGNYISKDNNNGSVADKTLAGNYSTLIFGTAFRIDQYRSNARELVRFTDGGTAQMSVRCNVANGRLEVYRNGTLLATGVNSLAPGVWYYIEFKVVFATGATGSYTLKINGVTELTASTVQTAVTNAYAGGIGIGTDITGGNQIQMVSYDDLYVCDASGSIANDFLGDQRIQYIAPTAAGAETQWTPNAGTNFSRVNETPPDGDTTYVVDSVVGHTDTYTMGDLTPTSGTINGIQPCVYARKDDAGARSIATVLRIGGVDYPQGTTSLSASYQMLAGTVALSPATSAAFTIAEINAMEAGVKVIS